MRSRSHIRASIVALAASFLALCLTPLVADAGCHGKSKFAANCATSVVAADPCLVAQPVAVAAVSKHLAKRLAKHTVVTTYVQACAPVVAVAACCTASYVTSATAVAPNLMQASPQSPVAPTKAVPGVTPTDVPIVVPR